MDDAEVEPVVVERTGLALVHQGELIVPAPGSEAVLTALDSGGLRLEFPVEVEVRLVDACDPHAHAELTLTRLLHALGGVA